MYVFMVIQVYLTYAFIDCKYYLALRVITNGFSYK